MRVRSPAWSFALGLLLLAGCRGGFPPAGPVALIESSLVFQPTQYPQGDWAPAGLAYEDVHFTAEDGTRLHGWYCPHPRPRAVVLLCHGNAGNITDWAGVLRHLNRDHGLAVMTFDYRGYGRSEGEPDEEGILKDARAARAWLARRTGVAERDVVLMGRSLGGAVAIDLAAKDGTRGLILESTFTSLPEVAGEQVAWLPFRLLMRNQLNSLKKIPRYHGPLLLSHGDADSLIPFEQSQRLFAAANEPKHFVRIPGGDHNDPQTPEYCRALDGFITALRR